MQVYGHLSSWIIGSRCDRFPNQGPAKYQDDKVGSQGSAYREWPAPISTIAHLASRPSYFMAPDSSARTSLVCRSMKLAISCQ